MPAADEDLTDIQRGEKKTPHPTKFLSHLYHFLYSVKIKPSLFETLPLLTKSVVPNLKFGFRQLSI